MKKVHLLSLIVLTVLLFMSAGSVYASGMYAVSGQNPEVPVDVIEGRGLFPHYDHGETPDIIERFLYGSEGRTADAKASKVPAVIVTLLLGPFGAHRVYLGTHVKVPVIYTLTLGGGFGILPLIDLVAVIITDDINRYVDNEKVIMWMTKE